MFKIYSDFLKFQEFFPNLGKFVKVLSIIGMIKIFYMFGKNIFTTQEQNLNNNRKFNKIWKKFVAYTTMKNLLFKKFRINLILTKD